MTGRQRLAVRIAGTAIALAGLVVEFVGFGNAAFLSGKSMFVGSLLVLAGIVGAAISRPKVTR